MHDHFDLIINDVPYIFGAEDYESGDDRDLCKVKNLDEYHKRMEVCLKNMKRLIKPSSWKDRVFHPIVMKVGSGRRNTLGTGLVSMDVELEIIARKDWSYNSRQNLQRTKISIPVLQHRKMYREQIHG